MMEIESARMPMLIVKTFGRGKIARHSHNVSKMGGRNWGARGTMYPLILFTSTNVPHGLTADMSIWLPLYLA